VIHRDKSWNLLEAIVDELADNKSFLLRVLVGCWRGLSGRTAEKKTKGRISYYVTIESN
jgi:hypothetical protein